MLPSRARLRHLVGARARRRRELRHPALPATRVLALDRASGDRPRDSVSARAGRVRGDRDRAQTPRAAARRAHDGRPARRPRPDRKRDRRTDRGGSRTMSAKSPLRPGVLSGIRVLDFTWKTVGPWAPRLLTHYGAEVIHVERARGYDDHRYNVTPSIVADEPKVAELPGTKKVYSDPQFNTLREESTAQTPGQKKLYAAPYFNTLHHGKL